jgi:hypothetical protein
VPHCDDGQHPQPGDDEVSVVWPSNDYFEKYTEKIIHDFEESISKDRLL